MYVDGVSTNTGSPMINRLNEQAQGHEAAPAPDFTMGEFIDILNPLQHIPGINTLYQNFTGDEASVRSRAIGSSLFGLLGGPVGMVGLMAANMVQMSVTGELEQETMVAESGADALSQKLAALEADALPTDVAGVSYENGVKDIPAMFGNVGMAAITQAAAAPDVSGLMPSASDDSEANAAQEKQAEETPVPDLAGLANDPRNVFPEDVLRQLQAKHLGES